MPLFSVSPESFTPVPKVYSSIVRLVPHKEPPVDIKSMSVFEQVVRQAFNMRRKTLRNSLKGLLGADQIESAGIDPGIRPECLGMHEFAALARLVN